MEPKLKPLVEDHWDQLSHQIWAKVSSVAVIWFCVLPSEVWVSECEHHSLLLHSFYILIRLSVCFHSWLSSGIDPVVQRAGGRRLDKGVQLLAPPRHGEVELQTQSISCNATSFFFSFYDVGRRGKTEACKFWSWWSAHHNYDKVIMARASWSASSTLVKWDNKKLRGWGRLKWAKQGRGKKKNKKLVVCLWCFIRVTLNCCKRGSTKSRCRVMWFYYFPLRQSASLLSVPDWFWNTDRKLTFSKATTAQHVLESGYVALLTMISHKSMLLQGRIKHGHHQFDCLSPAGFF